MAVGAAITTAGNIHGGKNEATGLLPADRTPAGYRTYGTEALERLEFIAAAKNLGLALEEIGDLLTVWHDGVCAQVKAELRPRVATRLEHAEAGLTEVTAFVASLRAALDRLDRLPDRTERCDRDCGVIDAEPRPRVGMSFAAHIGDGGTGSWRTAPIACSLSGAVAQQRLRQWRTLLDGAIRTPIDDGLRLSIPSEQAAAVAELAIAEQRCCPFFGFALHLDGPTLHLEVRAPADGAPLLEEVFGTLS